MNRIIRIGFSLATLLAAGCAHRSVNINSQPTGALVYINGIEAGRTPMKYDFDLYGDFDVILRMEGYETLKTHQNIKTPVHGYPPFDLCAELFGVRDEYEWNLEMAPLKTESVDPQMLIGRGIEMRSELQSSEYTRQPYFPEALPATPTTLPASPTTQSGE